MKSCGIQTVVRSRRSGHPIEGGHIRGWLSVCGFGVAETPVGGFANCPEGMPVLSADTTTDSEVIRVTDDRLGTQRPPLFEVLLDPGGSVIAAQRWIDSLG